MEAKNYIRGCIIFALMICIVCQDTKVVDLTTSNFENLTSTGNWFIKFYAPWCGHCKKLTPTWHELSLESGNNIAMVDCTQNNDLCSAFGVKGFPTLKYITGGKQYVYKGAREISNFVNFMEEGYLQTEGEAVPSLRDIQATPKAQSSQSELIAHFTDLAKANFLFTFIAIAVTFLVIGLVLGVMLDNCTRPSPRKPVIKVD